MNRWGVMLLVGTTALIQGYLLAAAEASVVVPWLVPIVLVAVAANRSIQLTLASALLAGFVLDSAHATDFGVRIVASLLLVGLVIYVQRWGVDIHRMITVILMSLVGVSLYMLLPVALTWLQQRQIVGIDRFLGIWAGEIILTTIVVSLTHKQLRLMILGKRKRGLVLDD